MNNKKHWCIGKSLKTIQERYKRNGYNTFYDSESLTLEACVNCCGAVHKAVKIHFSEKLRAIDIVKDEFI